MYPETDREKNARTEYQRWATKLMVAVDCLTLAGDGASQPEWLDGDLYYTLEQLSRAAEKVAECLIIAGLRHLETGHTDYPARARPILKHLFPGGPF